MSRFFFRFVKWLVILILLGFLSVVVVYFFLSPKLPEAESLKETQLQVPLRIFSAEGLLMGEFGEQRRIPVKFEEVPQQLIEAFLAAEDARFYEHPGVDYQGLLRAAVVLASTGEKTQGGSTITMQVARNFFLSNEKTYLRKINEIILSFEIEHILTKNEILELYLNKIFLGQRAYGIAAAAEVYYGKRLDDLTLSEMATIAGLPKAPSTTNPISNADRATTRRNYVLGRMLEVGFIDTQAYQQALSEPVTARYHSREIEVYAPYVAEMVRTQLVNDYGEDVYTNGFRVHTTIKADHQSAATTALQRALLAYDRRHGYRGATETLALESLPDATTAEQLLSAHPNVGPLRPSLVLSLDDQAATALVYIRRLGEVSLPFKSVEWARPQLSVNSMGSRPQKMSDVLKAGDIVFLEQTTSDWLLAQVPEAQAAFVAVSPQDGAITALQGGFDFFHSKYNRVMQSSRQPGSGFKPFLYSAALERGYNAATIVNDAPVVYDDPGLESVWRPQNYSGRFFGPTRIREALVHSRNLVSIRVLRDIGIAYGAEFTERFGFSPNQLPRNLSLSLGSGSAAPIDMARGYSVIANGGYRVEPYVVSKIEDTFGTIVMQAKPLTVCETCIAPLIETAEIYTEEAQAIAGDFMAITPAERVISAQNAFLIDSMLRDVVREGTGRQALSLGRGDLAGKTGTTNNMVDAWFNGYSPNLVAISWVGFDTPSTLGRAETGGRAALPMWIEFMKTALKDFPEQPPILPVDMVTVRIDPDTGLLARPGSSNTINEIFRANEVPTRMTSGSSYSDSGRSDDEESIIDLF